MRTGRPWARKRATWSIPKLESGTSSIGTPRPRAGRVDSRSTQPSARWAGRASPSTSTPGSRAHARRFAEALAREPGVEVLADVVLNQVLVRFLDPGGDHDTRTRAVVEAVRGAGTCWLGGTTWQGKAAMRISVSNWSTTTGDVDRSVAAILRSASEYGDSR